MNSLRKILSNNIRKYRVSKSMSQEDLAFSCGLHRTYISDVERGSRNISIDNIEKISIALHVSASDLLKEEC